MVVISWYEQSKEEKNVRGVQKRFSKTEKIKQKKLITENYFKDENKRK